MNEILNYNEYHDTTGDTECNDINNNEYKTKKCNLNEIQPALLSQDIYLNEEVNKDEEVDGKKTCICGSILSNKIITNTTRKYYNIDGTQYSKIKNVWVKHTTSCIRHILFKSILKYIFYKRRYNKLRKSVGIINKKITYKNKVFKEQNDDGVWISKKGYTNKSFIETIKKMTREVQMKIKNRGDDADAPIRESTINKVYYSAIYKKKVKELRNRWLIIRFTL